MILGGTPTTEAVTNLPMIGKLRRFATLRRVRRTAAAPSDTWDALPRVKTHHQYTEIE